MEEVKSPPSSAPLLRFFVILLGLAMIQFALGYIIFPEGWIGLLNLISSVVFVATPILALFSAAQFEWNWKVAVGFLAVGAAVHFGGESIRTTGVLDVGLGLLRQIGLVSWCLGLGALLACMIRDKNMVVPIAIFLALLDMFLVLTPIGLTQKMLTEHKETSQKVLYEVPKPKTQPEKKGEAPKRPVALAYVGPADFLFLGMFFVILFRFGMRTRETLYAIVPVLAGYLLIVLFAGSVRLWGISLGALPALLPIGVTIFVVNRKEFNLSKDEKIATILLSGLMIGLLAYGMTRPRPQRPLVPPPAAQK